MSKTISYFFGAALILTEFSQPSANPYIAMKADYKKDKCSYDCGIFAGITQGFGKKFKISAEAQRYRNYWGANVIASLNF